MKKQTLDTPFDVLVLSEKMGSSLKTARLRRGMTQNEAALRAGVGRELVLRAEKGKPVSSRSLFSLLWLYGLLNQMVSSVSDDKDIAGIAREKNLLPTRARKRKIDDEF